MAGIDKTYTKFFEQYKELEEWAENKKFKCPNGIVLEPCNYMYIWHEESFKGTELPVMNTSQSMDYFLIKYCPFEFVQDRMRTVYGEEYYNSIKNGNSEYDTFTKDGKYGKHCKIIKKPDCMMRKPLGDTSWWIQPSYKVEEDLWYNEDKDLWIWTYELGEATTNVCWKYKTIKSVIRHICKWKLPIGTILNVKSRYIGFDWVIKVTK